jgi:hypothetical protein
METTTYRKINVDLRDDYAISVIDADVDVVVVTREFYEYLVDAVGRDVLSDAWIANPRFTAVAGVVETIA